VRGPDAIKIDALRKQVEERCKSWQGVYLIPRYQIVTAGDVDGDEESHGGNGCGDADLLLFLSYGAFRIACRGFVQMHCTFDLFC
jgi:hypothetical protein